MALGLRDVPITRDQVKEWYDDWASTNELTDLEERRTSWRAYLMVRVNELNLDDEMVLTTAHEDLDDETHIVDMLAMDMESYG